jgi:hypothetical protein
MRDALLNYIPLAGVRQNARQTPMQYAALEWVGSRGTGITVVPPLNQGSCVSAGRLTRRRPQSRAFRGCTTVRFVANYLFKRHGFELFVAHQGSELTRRKTQQAKSICEY